jgi:hypothetical protein
MVSISPNPALTYSPIFHSEAVVKDFDFRLVIQEKDTSEGETEWGLTMPAFSKEAKTVPSGLSFLSYHHVFVKLVWQLGRLADMIAAYLVVSS